MEARAVVSLAVAPLAFLSVGFLFSFQTYFNLLHETFGYDRTQSSFVWVSGLAGLSVGVGPALLLPRLSPMWLCVLSSAFSTVSYLLLWSTTKIPTFYTDKAPLIAFFNFLSGHAMSYLYFTALYVCLKNAKKTRFAITSGFLHAFTVSSTMGCWLAVHRWSVKCELLFLIWVGVGVGGCLLGILGLRLVQRNPATLAPSASYSDVRTLTTSAYEYAPSDAESEDVGTSEDEDRGRSPLPAIATVSARVDSEHHLVVAARQSGWKKMALGGLLTAFAFSSAAAFGVAVNLDRLMGPGSSENGCDLFWFSAVVAFVVASVASDGNPSGEASGIPRPNFLLLAALLLFLTGVSGAARPELTGTWLCVVVGGGGAVGTFWSLVPALICEKYGRRRLVAAWSVGLFLFVVLLGVFVFSFDAVCGSVPAAGPKAGPIFGRLVGGAIVAFSIIVAALSRALPH